MVLLVSWMDTPTLPLWRCWLAGCSAFRGGGASSEIFPDTIRAKDAFS
jgi:hypothetical protein